MDGWQPLEQADKILGAVEGVYGPQNTPMLWWWSLPEQRSALRVIQTLSPPQNYICKLWGLSRIHSKHWCRAQGLMWGTRGPFLLAAAMAVAVVTPVVFCAKATEKCYKNTEISFLVAIILFITIYCKTYCSSRIANCSVAQARHVRSPNHFCPMEPGILGITRMLLSLWEWFSHCTEA